MKKQAKGINRKPSRESQGNLSNEERRLLKEHDGDREILRAEDEDDYSDEDEDEDDDRSQDKT